MKKDWKNYTNPDGTKLGEIPPNNSITSLFIRRKKDKPAVFNVNFDVLKLVDATPGKVTFEYHSVIFKNNNPYAGVLVSKYDGAYPDNKLPFVFVAEDDFKAVYQIKTDGFEFYKNATLIVYNDKEKDSFNNYYSTMCVDTTEQDAAYSKQTKEEKETRWTKRKEEAAAFQAQFAEEMEHPETKARMENYVEVLMRSSKMKNPFGAAKS